MKYYTSLFLIIIAALLSACSPHPGSGVWKATAENDYGIDKIIIAFDGKARFTSTKIINAKWHCFWTASNKIEINMECTPSTNPDQEEQYTLSVDDQGVAQMKNNTQLIASFTRQHGNPSPQKQ
ncbi:MAG: hypothetical protein COA54_10710 [Thiotrichaceae bacterium]|nr:MAG: hypothetical protein COA54_10710 [Thiotrichaceae bacterium]